MEKMVWRGSAVSQKVVQLGKMVWRGSAVSQHVMQLEKMVQRVAAVSQKVWQSGRVIRRGSAVGVGVSHAVSNSTVRAYAHCHPTFPADMTVLLLNLEPDDGTVAPRDVTIDTESGTAAAATEEYHLPAGPASATVALNGKLLQATALGELPAMEGRQGVAKSV